MDTSPSRDGTPAHFALTWHLTLKVNLKSQRVGHTAPCTARAGAWGGWSPRGPCAHTCLVLGSHVSHSASRPPPVREDPVSGCHQHGPPHLSHPDCGFQPGSPERLSDCGLDESYREVDGGWSGGTLQREGTGDSQKLRSQLPRERNGLATELAPRPRGASAAPALFSVCRGTGGGEPTGPEAGGAARPGHRR